jgi:hypothetical protein
MDLEKQVGEEERKIQLNVQKAEREFNHRCHIMQIPVWDIQRSLEMPYGVGASLSQPLKKGNGQITETEAIILNAEQTAQKYGLKAVYQGPCSANYGCVVMYIGFKGKEE